MSMRKIVTVGIVALMGATTVMAADPVGYMDWDPAEKKMVSAVCSSYETYSGQTTLAAGKWYVVKGDVQVGSRIVVSGKVDNPTRLILCDGAKLTAGAGIRVSVSGGSLDALVIYGQEKGTGELMADAYGGFTGKDAGIGGDFGNSGGAVTINGGIVTAIGGSFSAGIGGAGGYGSGGIVTINGGSVTAKGGVYGLHNS